jgi:hypothetical protein
MADLTDEQLEAMLERSAEIGAQRALAKVGLSDDLDTAKDIHDLRQLIDGWRDVKSTAVKTMVRWVVLCLLGCISIGVYMSINK